MSLGSVGDGRGGRKLRRLRPMSFRFSLVNLRNALVDFFAIEDFSYQEDLWLRPMR